MTFPATTLTAATLIAATVASASATFGTRAIPERRTAHREVIVQQMRFTPAELTLRLGDTVTFRNTDIVRHNAVRRGVFDTGELGSGASASWVPADTGTFGYQCTIHPRMRGAIVVEPAAR